MDYLETINNILFKGWNHLNNGERPDWTQLVIAEYRPGDKQQWAVIGDYHYLLHHCESQQDAQLLTAYCNLCITMKKNLLPEQDDFSVCQHLQAPEPINTRQQLSDFARQYREMIQLNSKSVAPAGKEVIQAARRLIQGSTASYSIVVPDDVPAFWGGDEGEWLPVMVFVPNHEIFSKKY